MPDSGTVPVILTLYALLLELTLNRGPNRNVGQWHPSLDPKYLSPLFFYLVEWINDSGMQPKTINVGELGRELSCWISFPVQLFRACFLFLFAQDQIIRTFDIEKAWRLMGNSHRTVIYSIFNLLNFLALIKILISLACVSSVTHNLQLVLLHIYDGYDTKGRSLCQAFLAKTVETGNKNRCVTEATYVLRIKLKKY